MPTRAASRRTSLLLAGLVVAAAFVGFPPAGAQDELPDGGSAPAGEPIPADDERGVVHSWALAPAGAGRGSQSGDRANLSYTMAPGTLVTDRVTLFNFSNVPLTFDVFPIDATNNDDGAFTPTSPEAEQEGVGAWVTVPVEALEVPAGEAASFDIVVNIPSDARPGDHAGAILAANDTTGTSPDGRVVNVDRQTGTRVYIRVDGPLSPELSVADLGTTYSPAINPLDGRATVTYRIENRGNVRLAGTHQVSVSGPLGLMETSGQVRELPELLPGESLEFTETLEGVAATGASFARVALDPRTVDGTEADVEAPDRRAIGLAIPYLLVVVLVVAALIWVARRRYRRHAEDHGTPPRGPRDDLVLEPQPT